VTRIKKRKALFYIYDIDWNEVDGVKQGAGSTFQETRGASQIQDRSPQSRQVASRNQSQTRSDATGLDCGDRSWICNAPNVKHTERNYQLKPTSITLAGSKLAPNMFGASFELASVMEFGREPASPCYSSLLAS